MKSIVIEKKCANCSKQYHSCEDKPNFEKCDGFQVKDLLQKISSNLNKEITVVDKKFSWNQYLYPTDVEDWADHHKTIWRLKLKLSPDEWKEIKRYFKFYRNRNLMGWGTTSPLEVSEILISLKGNEDIKKDLESINNQIAKVEKRQLWGYENDVFGEMDCEWDKQKLDYLKSIKRDWLGVVWG